MSDVTKKRTLQILTVGIALFILIFWGLRGIPGIPTIPIASGSPIINIPASENESLPATATTTVTPTTTITTTASPTQTATSYPTVLVMGWYRNGVLLAGDNPTIKLGESATLMLEVYGGEKGLVGKLTVEIKKDIIAQPDTVFSTQNFSVYLEPKMSKVVSVIVKPDQATEGSLREYFFKLYWNGRAFYDPTVPLSRFGLHVSR